MPAAWRQALADRLQRAWAQRGGLAVMLLPVALLYGALATLRRFLYRLQWFKTERVDAFVMVVGNVVAGGAGKTPTVISLVKHLRSQGHAVGVISRGYGRTGTQCAEVTASALAQDVGDEPLLIHRATQAPMFVAGSRSEAARALLHSYPGTQIVVCDDGLQHYGLYRDLEVCVFDDRGCGNGWLLPSGPLREPWPRSAVRQAGQRDDRLLVLHTGRNPAFAGFRAQRSLSSQGVLCNGESLLLSSLREPGNKPILAIAAIAQPQVFFAMLQEMGLPLAKTVALPDHYHFNSIERSVYKGYQLICTEKDAPKLWPIAPDAVAAVLVQTAEAAFFDTVDAIVAQELATTLSSNHGHQTS